MSFYVLFVIYRKKNQMSKVSLSEFLSENVLVELLIINMKSWKYEIHEKSLYHHGKLSFGLRVCVLFFIENIYCPFVP